MAKTYIVFFLNITLALLSESNVKKEVIEKIKKWLEEESIKFSIVEEPYSDFRLDIKNPNQTIVLPKNNQIL